jgi:hypothetical protein
MGKTGYWRAVHSRAFAEAAASLHVEAPWQLVIKALVIAAALGALVWLGSPDAARDELIVRVAIAWALALVYSPFLSLEVFGPAAALAWRTES